MQMTRASQPGMQALAGGKAGLLGSKVAEPYREGT